MAYVPGQEKIQFFHTCNGQMEGIAANIVRYKMLSNVTAGDSNDLIIDFDLRKIGQ